MDLAHEAGALVDTHSKRYFGDKLIRQVNNGLQME